MRIILLGAPGSGKGTVADRIEEACGFPKVSTGDLLRDAVREGTPAGLRAREFMESGGLVPDGLVLELLRERIARPDCAAGYTLDGFPRTRAQAESLDRVAPDAAEVVFEIRAAEATLVERLAFRRVCPTCHAIYNMKRKPPRRDEVCDNDGTPLEHRPDDRPEVVRRRLEVYRELTAPVVDYYAARGVLHPVDGDGSPEETYRAVRAVLDAPSAEAKR